MLDAGELVTKASSLKKVTTKEFEGSTEADLTAIARIYEEKQGSFQVLAQHFDISKDLIHENPPLDAKDFAKKLLEGLYLADKEATNWKGFRDNLRLEILRTQKRLRKSITKEFIGVYEADVAAAAKLYKDNYGDLEVLAQLCGVSGEILVERAPDSAEEFGTNLLLGHYSVDKTEESKAKVREILKDQIDAAARNLKKTVRRKESMSEPLDSQVDYVAKLWDEKTSIDELAINLGISAAIIGEKPPEDGQDFARKTFAGVYTVVGRERTMSVFRRGLKEQIDVQLHSLKSAVPNRPRSATEEDLENFGKFFAEQNGDISKIAKAAGISEQLLAETPPTDANDFAQKLLDGLYSVDKGAEARRVLRAKLRKEIRIQMQDLKKTHTKVWDGTASDEDIASFAKFYTENKGDLEALAKIFSLDPALMSEHKPTDAEDFAKKLLSGGYTFESAAIAALALREEMVKMWPPPSRPGEGSNLKEHHVPKLRHSETRSSITGPRPGDIAKVCKIFNDHKGDLRKLAVHFGASEARILEAQPKAANQFAVKLLSGSFADAEQEDQRDKMRGILDDGLKRRPSLRVSITKEALGEPKEEDIEVYAKIFDQECKGDLDEVAKRFNIDISSLKKDAPADSRKFATRFLQGGYKS